QQAQLCAVDGALAALSALSAPRASEATRAALPTLCAAAVEPVRSLDELCELHAALLESCDDPIELERLLDGLARFAAEEPADLAQRLAPLRKRARTLLKRQWGQPFSEARSLPSAIDGLALAWAERVVPAPEGDRKPQMMSELGLDGFVIWRCYEVAQRLARREAGPLLATPTQRDGFIDPMRLLERGRALTRAPDGYDAVQALLRLAHERRDEALRAFSAASSEVGRALRYALGAALEGPVSSPPLWVAAARARAPLEPSPELSEHLPRALRGAPDCDVPARNALRFSRRGRWSYVYVGTRPAPPSPRQSSRYVTLALHENSDSLDDSDTAFPGGAIFEGHAIAAAALIWPQQREPYYAEGLRCIGGNVEWHDAFWGYRRYLEPLLDAAEPCGEMAALLVATALGCKEPGERTLALDVATAAIEEGRLDGAALGAAYGQLVPNGLLTLPRLADTLAELARGSEHHAAQVCVALAGALRGDKAERGTHALLELLHELCMRSGAALDEHLDHGGEARAFLERNAQGGSKTAKLARTLLQLAPGAHRAEQARAAAVRALEGRLARAERLFVSTQER
ncbi:MAG: hypothetical protein KC503_19455, partial [Myxococcales bacterium]|nr:hypothetical protein [Myxococcales bacterium]